MLAGVSVTWYTWLEQGRPINASVDVLTALARALRLDDAERQHLLALATRAPLEPMETVEHAPDALVRLITSMEPAPAYVLGPRWDFLAWNRPQSLLYPLIDRLADDDRNLLWVVFAEPNARRLLVDWADQARRIMAEFRSGTAAIRNDPRVRRSRRSPRRCQPRVRRMVAAARRRPVPNAIAPLPPPPCRRPGVRVPATDAQRMAGPACGLPATGARRRQRRPPRRLAQHRLTAVR